MGKGIPLKSNDLEKLFNANVEEYGYLNKKVSVQKQDKKEETYRTDLRRQ